MKTIAIVAEKGGVGKTTLATHLAVYAQAEGRKTIIIDLDPQASARKWGVRRNAEPEVVSDHAEMLQELLRTAEEGGADLVIIDTAPSANKSPLFASKAADLVLLPCRFGAFDIEAIMGTYEITQVSKRPTFVVFNAVLPRSDIALREAEHGLISLGIATAPVTIHQRVAFRDAVNDGRTALEIEPDGKAAKEIQQLFQWAGEQVGLITAKPAPKKARQRVGAKAA